MRTENAWIAFREGVDVRVVDVEGIVKNNGLNSLVEGALCYDFS